MKQINEKINIKFGYIYCYDVFNDEIREINKSIWELIEKILLPIVNDRMI